MLGKLWDAAPRSCWLGRTVSSGWGTVLEVGAWEVAVEVWRLVCLCMRGKKRGGSCRLIPGADPAAVEPRGQREGGWQGPRCWLAAVPGGSS